MKQKAIVKFQKLKKLNKVIDFQISQADKQVQRLRSQVKIFRSDMNQEWAKPSPNKAKISTLKANLTKYSKKTLQALSQLGNLKKKKTDTINKKKIAKQSKMLASVKTQKSAIVSQYKSLKTKHKKLVQTIANQGVKGKPASSKNIKVAQKMKLKLDRLKTKFSKSKKKMKAVIKKNQKAKIELKSGSKKKITKKYRKQLSKVNKKLRWANKAIKAASQAVLKSNSSIADKLSAEAKAKLKSDIRRATDIKKNQLKLKAQIVNKDRVEQEQTKKILVMKNPTVQIQMNLLRAASKNVSENLKKVHTKAIEVSRIRGPAKAKGRFVGGTEDSKIMMAAKKELAQANLSLNLSKK